MFLAIQRGANHVHVEKHQMTDADKRNRLGLGLLPQPADVRPGVVVKQLFEQLFGIHQFSFNRYVVHQKYGEVNLPQLFDAPCVR